MNTVNDNYKGYIIEISDYNFRDIAYIFDNGKRFVCNSDQVENVKKHIDRLEFPKEFTKKLENILNDS